MLAEESAPRPVEKRMIELLGMLAPLAVLLGNPRPVATPSAFLLRWGRRALLLGMVTLGLALADAIGWLTGRPLLALGDESTGLPPRHEPRRWRKRWLAKHRRSLGDAIRASRRESPAGPRRAGGAGRRTNRYS